MWIIFIATILILPISICMIFSLIIIGIKCFYYFRMNPNPNPLPIIYVEAQIYDAKSISNRNSKDECNQDLPNARRIYIN
jgi:hypothetical protein